MQSVNLYTLSRITDVGPFAAFEKQLSNRKEIKIPKEKELSSLRLFVDTFLSCEQDEVTLLKSLDDFYFSFTIPKITKEFDLLRISDETVIDIELKSQATEKILQQLVQNKYYLKSLCRPVILYTFVSDNASLYKLTEDNSLVEVDFSELRLALQAQKVCFNQNIDDLFRASDFLISPLNTPDRFLNKEYFLTSHQEEIVKQILGAYRNKCTQYFGITGSPGTGKTLLLYDLASQLSKLGRICVIHCGIMPEGLAYLDSHLDNVDIIEAKHFGDDFDLLQYTFVLVDESHRFHRQQFERLYQIAAESQVSLVFSYDRRQILSEAEQRAQISDAIERLPNCMIFKLTDKIRTNKELASFIERLRDLHSHNIVADYPSVTIAYANNREEADMLLKNFRSKNYTFINYTSSTYYGSNFDRFNTYCHGNNTHTVIGQEFENVVMILDETFQYDENGKLRAKIHPNPNYLYTQLLFQGVSRVRERLSIVVLNNAELFERVIKIVH